MRYPRNIKILKCGYDTSAILSVFFVLITFMLLNSSFVLKKGVHAQLELPKADLPGITGACMIVGIDRDGKYYHDGQIWNEEKEDSATKTNTLCLLGKMSSAIHKTPTMTLVIVPDKDASVEKLSQLTALAYHAGIQKILIATDGRTLDAP